MSPPPLQSPVDAANLTSDDAPKRHFGLCSALATVDLAALLNALVNTMGIGGCIFFPFYAVPPFLALLLSLSAKVSFRRYAWEILITWTPLTMYYIIRVIEDANSDPQSALIHIFLPFILFAYTAIGAVVLELLFRISIGLLPRMRRFFELDDSLPALGHAEALIPQAAAFAENAHAGQFRKGPGKVPYFTHPHAVAQLVAKHSSDPELVIAAYLHDTMEDCHVTYKELADRFGNQVADRVQELTNDEEQLKKEGKVPYMRKKLLDLASDTLLVKLCDTLHNTSQSTSLHQVNNYLKIIRVLGNRKDLSDVHRKLIRSIRSTAAARHSAGFLSPLSPPSASEDAESSLSASNPPAS